MAAVVAPNASRSTLALVASRSAASVTAGASAATLSTGRSATGTTTVWVFPATSTCDEDAITQAVAVLSYIRSTTSAVSSVVGYSSTTVEAAASEGPLSSDEHVQRLARRNRNEGLSTAAQGNFLRFVGRSRSAVSNNVNRRDAGWNFERLLSAGVIKGPALGSGVPHVAWAIEPRTIARRLRKKREHSVRRVRSAAWRRHRDPRNLRRCARRTNRRLRRAASRKHCNDYAARNRAATKT